MRDLSVCLPAAVPGVLDCWYRQYYERVGAGRFQLPFAVQMHEDRKLSSNSASVRSDGISIGRLSCIGVWKGANRDHFFTPGDCRPSRERRQRTLTGLVFAQPVDASHDEIASVAAPAARRLIDMPRTDSLGNLGALNQVPSRKAKSASLRRLQLAGVDEAARLPPPQRRVVAVEPQQFVMRALLGDMAAIAHHQPVHARDGREPMRA